MEFQQKWFDPIMDRIINAISNLEQSRTFWTENDLAEIAGITIDDARSIIKTMNL